MDAVVEKLQISRSKLGQLRAKLWPPDPHLRWPISLHCLETLSDKSPRQASCGKQQESGGKTTTTTAAATRAASSTCRCASEAAAYALSLSRRKGRQTRRKFLFLPSRESIYGRPTGALCRRSLHRLGAAVALIWASHSPARRGSAAWRATLARPRGSSWRVKNCQLFHAIRPCLRTHPASINCGEQYLDRPRHP